MKLSYCAGLSDSCRLLASHLKLTRTPGVGLLRTVKVDKFRQHGMQGPDLTKEANSSTVLPANPSAGIGINPKRSKSEACPQSRKPRGNWLANGKASMSFDQCRTELACVPLCRNAYLKTSCCRHRSGWPAGLGHWCTHIHLVQIYQKTEAVHSSYDR